MSSKQTKKNQPVAQPKAVTPQQHVTTATTAVQASQFSLRNLCILLGVISIGIYINTIWNGFVMDDVMVLKDNRYVQKGFDGVAELMATPHMRGYLIIPNDLYRPFSLVAFAVEYGLFGLAPKVHHLFNLLYYAGCSIMLFLFMDKFFDHKRTALAFLTALIFAVHPIHTEVVANIKSRDELMSFFFGFLALNLYANYMKQGKMLQLILGIVSFYLAIISKETVIAFVGLIPLIFFIYIDGDKKRASFISVGSLVAFLIFMGVRSSVLNTYDANQPAATVEFIDNALAGAPDFVLTGAQVFTTKVVVMGHYLRLMFLPYPLLSTYSYNAIPFSSFADYRFWLSILAYVGIFYAMVTRFKKDKKDPWVFAIIFFLATIFLFSNFPFLMGAELAERFAFFASVGACLALALALEKWVLKATLENIDQLKTGKMLTVLLPLVVLFGGWTFARGGEWESNVSLYRADLGRSPNDVRLYHNLGSALAEELYEIEPDSTKKKAIDQEALGYLRKGVEIYPGYSSLYVEMARIYDRNKVYDSAVKYNSLALKLNPTDFTANNNMGSVLLTSGRYRDAIPYFKIAMESNPNFKYAYINIARCYTQLQRYDSAIYNYHRLREFDPQNIDIAAELGTAHFLLNNYDSAQYYFKLVLQVRPDDANMINNIGAILLNNKKYAEAAEYFKKAVTLNPNYLNGYSNLAKSYYFSGQYAAAIDIINKEMQIDQQNSIKDIPYIALSYQKMGNMAEAKKWEGISRQYYSNFALE